MPLQDMRGSTSDAASKKAGITWKKINQKIGTDGLENTTSALYQDVCCFLQSK